MKISKITHRLVDMELVRPYTIAFTTFTSVSNHVVEIHTDSGLVGIGTGSAAPLITGETNDDASAALTEAAADLIGCDVDLEDLGAHILAAYPGAPAARAALDIAFHDLVAKAAGLSVVDLLGRSHTSLPTSITIGIKDTVDEVIEEAREYLGRGFRSLKVKLGKSIDDDIARLEQLRASIGPDPTIRVDPNQGYNIEELARFFVETEPFGVEFVEQPLADDRDDDLLRLSDDDRRLIAADESLHSPGDAHRLAGPPALAGIFNIKLMKCGGISPALGIADVADATGIDLMWGCMDESVVSISAALHAALASPATRYLDLDGSLDLARDVATGGFELVDGMLSTRAEPGLGAHLL